MNLKVITINLSLCGEKMKVIKNDYQNINIEENLTLTIGNFDGVHLGHQALIKEVCSFSDTKKALMTFYPHPHQVFKADSYYELATLEEKIASIAAFDLDYLLIVNFKENFYQLDKNEFILFLKKINVVRLVIGRDFRFAKGALGTVSDLKEHFDVIIMEDVKSNHQRVSTSAIKTLIKAAKFEEAAALLTRPYQIKGKVVEGNKVGRTLGVPTANLEVGAYLLPRNGVYLVEVLLDNKIYAGALNIGYNPSINQSKTKKVEVHILDFDANIYGKDLLLTFLNFLRPEKKFSTKEELIQQMMADLRKCQKLFLESHNKL